MLVDLVLLDQKDWMAFQESMVILDRWDHRAKMDHKVRLVCKVFLANKDLLDHQEYKALPALLDLKVMLDQ